MDEKLSYKEFLDRNDTWAMDDRDLCFEPQPVFKPMEMAGKVAPLFGHFCNTAEPSHPSLKLPSHALTFLTWNLITPG